MKVDLDTVRESTKFEDVKPSDGFLHSGKLYIKFTELVLVDMRQHGLDGCTRDIEGFNCVCLENGRPGSFKDTTHVRLVKVVVVRDMT